MLFRFWLGIILALGVLMLFLYGADKYKAKKRRWRIPEGFLLAMGFCGGAAGALLGMAIFRHKTKKWYFTAVNLLGLLWQIFLLWFLWGV